MPDSATVSPLSASQAAGDPWKDSGDISDSGSSTTSGHWSSAGSATASPPHCPGSATASPPHHPGSATASPPHCPGSATASPPHCPSSATASPPHYPGSATASPPHHPGSATASPPPRAGSVTLSPLSDDGFDTDPEPPAPDEPAPRRRKGSARLLFKCLWPGCGKVLRSGVGIKRHVRTRHLGALKTPRLHLFIPFYPLFIPFSPLFSPFLPFLPLFPPQARSRSLSLSDPQAPQPPPLLPPRLLVASPPRASLSTRKTRGEAKKCRKVYGIEHREQWCTACRWKKACQRFLD
ncbi:zinc finger protein 395 [Pyrgilauda ruficollis]|uniref:zinc finger protein 395 n=1 Tax=Pyrgilauda ruficollis TaxID=221976 RepID=UPI001B8772DE|nr:zinc finger protein 395 [Pyrgilauda ruficollis]